MMTRVTRLRQKHLCEPLSDLFPVSASNRVVRKNPPVDGWEREGRGRRWMEWDGWGKWWMEWGEGGVKGLLARFLLVLLSL